VRLPTSTWLLRRLTTARYSLVIGFIEAITETQLREQLIADWSSPENAGKILDNFRLLWSSYDTADERSEKGPRTDAIGSGKFLSPLAIDITTVLNSGG